MPLILQGHVRVRSRNTPCARARVPVRTYIRIALFAEGFYTCAALSGVGDRNTEFSAYIKSDGGSLMAASCKCARVLPVLLLTHCLSVCGVQGFPARGSSRARILNGGFGERGAPCAKQTGQSRIISEKRILNILIKTQVY